MTFWDIYNKYVRYNFIIHPSLAFQIQSTLLTDLYQRDDPQIEIICTPLHIFKKVQFFREKVHSFYEILKRFLSRKIEIESQIKGWGWRKKFIIL